LVVMWFNHCGTGLHLSTSRTPRHAGKLTTRRTAWRLVEERSWLSTLARRLINNSLPANRVSRLKVCLQLLQQLQQQTV